MSSNTVSEEGIAKINVTSKLVLRKRGDSAVEFYNDANRLYVLHFIEVAEMGSHHVFYFWLNLAKGKRGGVFDKEMGRMIVAVLAQYLEEHLMVSLSQMDCTTAIEDVLSLALCYRDGRTTLADQKDYYRRMHYQNGINCIYLNYYRS